MTRRARSLVAFSALAMLAYLPATYLARLIDFHDEARVGVLGVPRRGGGRDRAPRRGRRRGRRLDPLLVCLGVVYGLLVIDMLIGAPLQLNAVFGYSPTVGGRFAGMGNLAYGMFAGAAFLIFGLVLQRLAGWRFATVAALSACWCWRSSSTACRCGGPTSAGCWRSSPPWG